jgi:DNA-binding NtrC family response regulator
MTMPNFATDPRVLIVEDEVKMRELLVRAINSWGLEASAAKSGEEALRLMDGSLRQIVILDLNLPGMGGMECFAQIRQRWPDTQVIVLTGFGDLDAAKQAIHLDVVEFLTKPCHLGELEVALGRAKLRLLDKMPLPEQPPEQEQPEIPPQPMQPPTTLDEVERQHILATLAKNHGNRSATAAELGISLRTLYYRLNEYERQGIRVN